MRRIPFAAALLAALAIHSTTVRAAAAQAPTAQHASRAPHVVLVVSAAGRDSGRTHPGYEQDELSQAWLLFTRNGYRVTIASPTGGAVVADEFDADKDYNAAFFADTAAVTQLRATRRTAGMSARDVNAVMVMGGKGAMFDLPLDTALARLIGQVYDQGGVVSAVCHGPAGLLRARTRDGRLIVAGRAMTGFTNEEESVFGKQWRPKFAFLLEDEARRVGARWDEAPLMMPRVVVDGRLVTGQNPFSTSEATDAVITAMGRTPLKRDPWRDEASVYAAVRLLAEEPTLARRQLAEIRSTLQIEYIGMLGYYQLVVAEAQPDIQRAVNLMELASPYMDAPQLTLGLARGYHRLGRAPEARALARALASREGEVAADARALLESMQR